MAPRKILLLCGVLALVALPTVLSHAAADRIPVKIKRALARGDIDIAITWLRQAAEQDNGTAALKLANIYRLGQHVNKDVEKSEKYLLLAANNGVAEGQYLLGLHYNRDHRSSDAITWLSAASVQGHSRATRMLAELEKAPTARDIFELVRSSPPRSGLLNDFDVNAVDTAGRTALIVAVQEKRKPWVSVLLDVIGKQQLDLKDRLGNSALHYAVEAGDVEIVTQLLSAKADISATNNSGATALHLAIATGNEKLVQALIWKGADLEIKDESGWTPSMLISRANGHGIAARGQHDGNKRRRPARQACDVAGLNVALRGGDSSRVEECVREGVAVDQADPDARDARGADFLSQVVRASNSTLAKRLVDASVDLQQTDLRGRSALHHAVIAGCDACVQLLVEAGCDVNVGDSDGRSALWWASKKQQSKAMSVLLANGAKHTPDNDQVSPLHIAVEFMNPQILSLLVGSASSNELTALTSNGNTPLVTAAYHDNSLAVRRLLEKGVDVDAPKSNSDTALIVAVRQNSIEAARVLVEMGASLNRRNDQRQSASTLIQEFNDPNWQSIVDQAPSELELLIGKLTQD